ncbi:sugar transferase [Peribacillus sp. SCS-37]|uniref:sugar transferase n=1 Tax=Paraperibacillus esterisolvens TaxID=3115296 RepID=UPI003905E23C
MKRIFDVFASIILLFFLMPFIVIIGIAVKCKIGSPIIFKQKRAGYKGKEFFLFKFRTMKEDVDSVGNLLPDHLRLTKLGSFLRKYSLDELLQLINVIKGDISIVGPRPLLMDYLPLYTASQAKRHSVKPGITGWAQVNGRNAISWEKKFELDIWYVNNQSFLLDLKILFMTIWKVCKSQGINQEGNATVEPFKGSIKSVGEGS